MTPSGALYEALTAAPDACHCAPVIDEAFDPLDKRYARLPDLALQGHLRESERRLQKEIERIRAEDRQQ